MATRLPCHFLKLGNDSTFFVKEALQEWINTSHCPGLLCTTTKVFPVEFQGRNHKIHLSSQQVSRCHKRRLRSTIQVFSVALNQLNFNLIFDRHHLVAQSIDFEWWRENNPLILGNIQKSKTLRFQNKHLRTFGGAIQYFWLHSRRPKHRLKTTSKYSAWLKTS